MKCAAKVSAQKAVEGMSSVPSDKFAPMMDDAYPDVATTMDALRGSSVAIIINAKPAAASMMNAPKAKPVSTTAARPVVAWMLSAQ